MYNNRADHYPCAMFFMRRPLTLLLVVFLGACTFSRPEEQPPAPACPVVEEPHCPEPTVVEKVVVKEVPVPAPAPPPRAPAPVTAGELKLPVVGAVEWAMVEPSGLTMEARIDTGAETTSIHAEDVRLVERDSKRYVQFNLIDPATGEKVAQEIRLRRRVWIKQFEIQKEKRFVVKMWITLGEVRERVDVTLSDRQAMEYPLLVGRNFLTDALVVDVSRHHTLDRPELNP